MKNTKINLLLHQESHKKALTFFKFFRIGVYTYGLILSILLTALFLYNQKLSMDISDLSQRKSQYLAQIATKEDDEVKFVYLSKKVKLIDNYLKQDTEFKPYYDLLAKHIDEATIEADLETFIIDKDRQVDFQIAVGKFNDLPILLGLTESSTFLKNFLSLTLEKVSNQAGTSNASEEAGLDSYQITFSGKFKPLNEITN